MSKTTQTELVRRSLAEQIVRGVLRPGEALDETQLAADFCVSRTPVREAIRQLEAIGLAQSRPHRGAVVAGLSEGELRDVFVVMAELEALCAALSATAMSGAERQALGTLHAAGSALVARHEVEAYGDHNDAFHERIYAGAHNAFLLQTTLSVRRRLAPFRRAQFEADGRLARSHAEHGLVADAIGRGAAAEAAEAMRAHILFVGEAADSVAFHPVQAAAVPAIPA